MSARVERFAHFQCFCRYSREICHIHAPNHTEIMHNALRHPTPPSTMIVRTTCALTGVTNIDAVLHVALPNVSMAQRK